MNLLSKFYKWYALKQFHNMIQRGNPTSEFIGNLSAFAHHLPRMGDYDEVTHEMGQILLSVFKTEKDMIEEFKELIDNISVYQTFLPETITIYTDLVKFDLPKKYFDLSVMVNTTTDDFTKDIEDREDLLNEIEMLIDAKFPPSPGIITIGEFYYVSKREVKTLLRWYDILYADRDFIRRSSIITSLIMSDDEKISALKALKVELTYGDVTNEI